MNFACNRVWPAIAALLLTGIVACASVPDGDSCSVAHVDRVVYVRALQISAPEIKVTGKVVPGMAELVRDRIQNVFKREGVVVDAASGQAPGVAIYWNVVSANEAGMCYPATRYCLTFGYAPFYLRQEYLFRVSIGEKVLAEETYERYLILFGDVVAKAENNSEYEAFLDCAITRMANAIKENITQ